MHLSLSTAKEMPDLFNINIRQTISTCRILNRCMAIFWCLVLVFFLWNAFPDSLHLPGLWFRRSFSEYSGETLTPYSWIFNTFLVGCGKIWAKSLQLEPCWICCLSSALKTAQVLTPSPKIVELVNSGTLLSVKGLGLCPQGEEQVFCEKLSRKLTTVYLEKKVVFLLCVLTGTHLPLKYLFLSASTLLS